MHKWSVIPQTTHNWLPPLAMPMDHYTLRRCMKTPSNLPSLHTTSKDSFETASLKRFIKPRPLCPGTKKSTFQSSRSEGDRTKNTPSIQMQNGEQQEVGPFICGPKTIGSVHTKWRSRRVSGSKVSHLNSNFQSKISVASARGVFRGDLCPLCQGVQFMLFLSRPLE